MKSPFVTRYGRTLRLSDSIQSSVQRDLAQLQGFQQLQQQRGYLSPLACLPGMTACCLSVASDLPVALPKRADNCNSGSLQLRSVSEAFESLSSEMESLVGEVFLSPLGSISTLMPASWQIQLPDPSALTSQLSRFCNFSLLWLC